MIPSTKAIYLLEDRSVFRRKFSVYLNKLRITADLRTYENADEFLSYYKSNCLPDNKPDILFLDIDLGEGLNGLDIAEIIQSELGNDIVLGICSTSDSDADIQRARDLKLNFYILKTGRQLFQDRLKETIRHCIEESNPEFLLLV